MLERWIKWLTDFALSCGAKVERDTEKMRQLGQEFPNLRMVILWCKEQERHDSLVKLCQGTWPYAYRMVLFTDTEDMAKVWLHATIATHDKCAEGQVLLNLAWLYWNWERDSDAIALLDRAEVILEECGDYGKLAETSILQCYFHYRGHRYQEGMKCAKQALELGERFDDPGVMASACAQLARGARTTGDLVNAMMWLDQAEKWAARARDGTYPKYRSLQPRQDID